MTIEGNGGIAAPVGMGVMIAVPADGRDGPADPQADLAIQFAKIKRERDAYAAECVKLRAKNTELESDLMMTVENLMINQKTGRNMSDQIKELLRVGGALPTAVPSELDPGPPAGSSGLTADQASTFNRLVDRVSMADDRIGKIERAIEALATKPKLRKLLKEIGFGQF